MTQPTGPGWSRGIVQATVVVPVPGLARAGSDPTRLALLATSLVVAGPVPVRLGRASRAQRG